MFLAEFQIVKIQDTAVSFFRQLLSSYISNSKLRSIHVVLFITNFTLTTCIYYCSHLFITVR